MHWMWRIISPAAALLAAVLLAPASYAATCGLTGQTVSSLGNVDPFAPSGTSVANFTLRLNRAVGPGGQKTQSVRFYLSQPSSGTAYNLTYLGQNIAYVDPTVPSGFTPITGSPSGITVTNGVMTVNFGGAAQPDFIDIPMSVTIPPNADLSAGIPIVFDVHYYCKGTGGMDDLNTAPGGLIQNAVTLTVNVLSALQASYVGSALDFGEIGDLTTAGLGGAGLGRTRRTGDVRVRSSGPYTVALSSQNGFFMTYAGNGGLASQRIPYTLKFLGLTFSGIASPGSGTGSPVACSRAGVPLPGQLLTLQADLNEGGQGKAPSPSYSDILTITVTPVAAGSPGVDCAALLP